MIGFISQVSKYIIVLLMAIYTFQCFYVFRHASEEKRKGTYILQNIFMFLLLFLALQQIEGNIIYPKVVGGSVGLPSIWVLMAVTIGGNVMGVAGMLIFIPLASVLYALIKNAAHERLTNRGIKEEKWRKNT